MYGALLLIDLFGKYGYMHLVYCLVVVYTAGNHFFCLLYAEMRGLRLMEGTYRSCLRLRYEYMTSNFTSLDLEKFIEFENSSFTAEVPLSKGDKK